MSFDVGAVRARFPSLARTVGDEPAVFFDGPAGSQVPRDVIDAMAGYLATSNANGGGSFVTSLESDQLVVRAQRAVADLIGAAESEAVVFGANMTTLTFALSRTLARTWEPGDEVVVTRLDHDANVTPWVLAARDAGAVIKKVGFRRDDCTLDLEELAAAIGPRTRLVAVGAASNATGTVNPVAEIGALCRAAGAELFVDAVHYAPHRLVDVEAWGCDYAACSAYKFFGPHVGILWGRQPRFAELPCYQVRPAGDALPGRWMTGTTNFEGVAGTLAAVDYMAGLGGADGPARHRLTAAYERTAAHERALTDRLLAGLSELEAVTVWGIADRDRLDERVATVAITHARRSPREIAAELGERGIFVWAGHFYAVEVTAHLGLDPDGVVRIGLLHYNTTAEVDRLLAALASL